MRRRSLKSHSRNPNCSKHVLAINGGKPVHDSGWLLWPPYDNQIPHEILKVAKSGRWSPRGKWTGQPTKSDEVSSAILQKTGATWCVPTSSGSSSLLIALEALDVGFGDEVIIPVMTWVATAAAVVNVNAIPRMVDIDPDTACINPANLRQGINKKTKCIIPVHLFGSVANMDEILAIGNEARLPIIEDCAQAFGAEWRTKSVGTLGDVGIFSFNQEKTLACGEGGAAITSDDTLFKRLIQLRTDGEQLTEAPRKVGEYEYVGKGGLFGGNYCLSEFQSAVLAARLKAFEKENATRLKNATALEKYLKHLGIATITRYPQCSERQYTEFAMKYSAELFGHKTITSVCAALSLELGFPVYTADEPLNRNALYCPSSKKRHAIGRTYTNSLEPKSALSFPGAEEAYATYMLFHHSVLLAKTESIHDIAEAVEKVINHSSELPDSI